MHTKYFGRCEYSFGLKVQDQSPIPAILGFEFEPVITLGRRSNDLQDLIQPLPRYQIVRVDRGGEATLHHPGQLVIYPLFDLYQLKIGPREFVHNMILITQSTLKDFGISTLTSGEEPGLFTLKGKVAFFGLRIRSGVTSHGLSINVHNDLEDFGNIRSCGVQQQKMDSMKNHAVACTLKQVFDRWILNAGDRWKLDSPSLSHIAIAASHHVGS